MMIILAYLPSTEFIYYFSCAPETHRIYPPITEGGDICSKVADVSCLYVRHIILPLQSLDSLLCFRETPNRH